MSHPAEKSPEPAIHLTLRECTDQVARTTATRPARGWSSDLAADLDRLRVTILRHFRRDEDERLNAAFLGDFPRFELRLQDLLSEHGVLLDRLDCLRARALDLPGGDGPACGRLARDVGIFLVEIERHEAAERDLVLTAQCTDLGSGE